MSTVEKMLVGFLLGFNTAVLFAIAMSAFRIERLMRQRATTSTSAGGGE